MTSSNRAAMFPNKLTEQVVVDGKTTSRQPTGIELDPNDPNPLGLDLSVNQDDLPRQVFAKHMQDSMSDLESGLLLDEPAIKRGVLAGVEMTLDVIHMHGYKVIDPDGNVVNPTHSLACGIWAVYPT